MMAEGQRRRLVTDIPAGLAGSKVDRKPLKVQGGGQRQVVAPFPGPWECFPKGSVKAAPNSGSPPHLMLYSLNLSDNYG